MVLGSQAEEVSSGPLSQRAGFLSPMETTQEGTNRSTPMAAEEEKGAGFFNHLLVF